MVVVCAGLLNLLGGCRVVGIHFVYFVSVYLELLVYVFISHVLWSRLLQPLLPCTIHMYVSVPVYVYVSVYVHVYLYYA